MVGDVAPRAQQPVAAVRTRPRLDAPDARAPFRATAASALRRSSSKSPTRSSVSHSPAVYDSPKPSLPRVARRRKSARSWMRSETAGPAPNVRVVPSGSVTSSDPPSRCASSRSSTATATRSTSAPRGSGAARRRALDRAHARTDPSPRHERRLVVERHPLQPETQRLPVDERRHLQRHQRIARERPRDATRSSARAGVRAARPSAAARRSRARGCAPRRSRRGCENAHSYDWSRPKNGETCSRLSCS